jgi:hypothetical protein
VAKIKGYPPAELVNPFSLPDLYAHLWRDFWELHQTRQVGMSANAITYAEIEAYSRLLHRELSTSDVTIIKRLDALFLNSIKD